ncbi:MAG: tetratricopeptide repeat protein, partial [Pyrinomonadaceae bacterium]
KHRARIILFTVGFASACALIFLLSFNFQSASSVKSNDVRASPQKQYTTNDEAYRLYLLGSALAAKLNRNDSAKAIAAYEQAIKLDPNYAPAYAGLANVHTAIAFLGVGGNPTEEYLKAKNAVEKSLEIDDNLAEAHSYLGEIKTNFEWDFAAAEREHKRAAELNPNSAAARRMYALLLSFLDRPEESIAEIKTAIDLEPASVHNHMIYGQTLFYAHRYDEAIAEGKRTLELDAEFLGVFDTVIGSYLMKGDGDQAFEWFMRQCELKKNKPEEIESWKIIYAQSGWRGIRERQLEQAQDDEKNGNPNPMPLARLYAQTGNPDQSFVYLERAFDKRWQGITSLKVSPNYDPLRSDPRFADLLKRIGLKP